MAKKKCYTCNRNMPDASSCVGFPYCEGTKKYPRIVFEGVEVGKALPQKTRAVLRNCQKCGVLPSGFHHPGCPAEKCPKCGGLQTTCRCDLTILGDH